MLLPNLRSPRVVHPRPCGRPAAERRHRFAPDPSTLEARALLSTLTVTNDNDSGTGSLRFELGAARPGDTIRFAPTAFGTIALTGGPLEVATRVDIHGPGANRITVSGDGKSDVFDVEGGVTATISGLTVADGSYAVSYGFGAGGILNQGTLTLSDDVVTGNSVAAGASGAGGIGNFGALTIAGSSISRNTGNLGGGIYNEGSLSVTDSTISGNTSTGSGGGIFSFADVEPHPVRRQRQRGRRDRHLRVRLLALATFRRSPIFGGTVVNDEDQEQLQPGTRRRHHRLRFERDRHREHDLEQHGRRLPGPRRRHLHGRARFSASRGEHPDRHRQHAGGQPGHRDGG